MFRLIFVVVGGKVQCFCLICGIYARFAKKMADSAQLILPLTLGITYLYKPKCHTGNVLDCCQEI